MKINFLTIFPKYYNAFKTESIVAKAIEKKIIEINIIDFRNFTLNRQNKVDDEIYGGGSGMLLMIEPIDRALESIKEKTKVILMSPQGKPFTQQKALELSKEKSLTFIAGRYEGFDERIYSLIDEEISIGDYVLTGGELPSMVVADSVIRLIPNVIKKDSYENDSFQNNLLDYPQYTRPAEYKGMKVPEVLLNGNHKEIEKWRKEKSLENTKKKRPDLLERKNYD
ncbi:tRNA (guanosine(37)-N1)-methyltransferase TrmD [Mesomycoplasma moatsii]|uniref:tRNA (guanosine(37)-N1)-methyltransferase TrmD n=1 Tax=Mesomycoplasma moatsii TaxID=171287 RepID=UPI0003B6CDD4